MAASFPSAVKVFATRSAGQVIASAHIDDLQDEVHAIEDGYLNGTAPINASNATFGRLSVSVASTFVAMSVTGASTLNTLNVTGGSTLSELFVTKAPPTAIVFQTSTIALPTGTLTGISFNSERFVSTSVMHSTGVNSSRLVAPSSGIYQITGAVNFAAFSTVGMRAAFLVLNDASTIAAQATRGNPSAGAGVQVIVSRVYAMNANDYVTLVAFQDSGSTGSLLAVDAYSQECSLVKIR